MMSTKMQPGGILEDVQIMHTRQNQMGHLLPSLRKTMVVVDSGDKQAAGLRNTSVFSDHQHSELTCNHSESRERLPNQHPTLVAPVAVLPQLVRFANPPLLAAQTELKAGSGAHISSAFLDISYDQSLRAFNSVATSTSGRRTIISTQPTTATAMISHELIAQICHQNFETDALIRLQNEGLRLAVEELGKRHCRSLLSIFQQRLEKRLQEKDIELENASRRYAELEEKINQVCAENQLWFNLARSSEAVASSLRRRLEQVLLENSCAAAAALKREGYGDSDGAQFIADDAQSCCFEDQGRLAAPATGTACQARPEIQRQVVCKVCGGDAVCVLVLPCRHLCLCEDCETSVSMCPICNHTKKACLRIFMS